MSFSAAQQSRPVLRAETSSRHRGTLIHVQALRAAAALLVVLLHTLSIGAICASGNSISKVYDLANFGAVGVDIFFVISGFIMVYVRHDQFQRPGATRSFLVRRFIRVAPIYWLFTALYVALLLIVPSAFNEDSFDLGHTIRSFLFIPSANPETGSPYPVLTPGWTLTFEMYFYAIFACFLLTSRRFFLPGLTLLFIISTLASQFGFAQASLLGTITEPLLLEFLLGCYIGVALVSGVRLPRSLCSAIFLAGLGLLIYSIINGSPDVSGSRGGFERFFAWGLPSALMVCGAIFYERIRSLPVPRVFVALGDSSYSLYLSHIFTLPLIAKLWAHWAPLQSLPGDVFVVIAVCASAVVGHLCYQFIEQPVNKALKPLATRLAG